VILNGCGMALILLWDYFVWTIHCVTKKSVWGGWFDLYLGAERRSFQSLVSTSSFK